MKFKEPRRHNPFDHPLVAVFVHMCALAIAVGAVWGTLVQHSWTPLWLGIGVLTLMKGMWWYFLLRR